MTSSWLLRSALLATFTLSTAAPAHAALPDAALDAEASTEVVAEALFLPDTLPPGGTDLNLSFAFERHAVETAAAESIVVTLPRLQLAQALGGRVGFTADVGLSSDGTRLVDPCASLKVLLLDGGDAGTSLSASADWLGTLERDGTHEAALGLGVLRAIGPVTLRASALAASPVSTWEPHAQGGLSAALALGSRWRALLEVVGDAGSHDRVLHAGPSLKALLGEQTALMFGALLRLAGATADPVYVLQLTQSM